MEKGLLSKGTAPEKNPERYTDETDSNVSPEEQAQYSQFEENYLALIYTPEGDVREGVLESLQAGEAQKPQPSQDDDPEAESIQNAPPHLMALASAAVTIVARLDDSAREAGQPLSDDVLQHGGLAVVEELGQVAEESGIYDYTPEDLSGAFSIATDMYREKAIADGRTDEDTLKGQWDEAVQANEQGRLGDIIPGMEGQQQ